MSLFWTLVYWSSQHEPPAEVLYEQRKYVCVPVVTRRLVDGLGRDLSKVRAQQEAVWTNHVGPQLKGNVPEAQSTVRSQLLGKVESPSFRL